MLIHAPIEFRRHRGSSAVSEVIIDPSAGKWGGRDRVGDRVGVLDGRIELLDNTTVKNP